MTYANGKLPASALSPIPGGRLRHDAAAAWNDMREEIGRKHGVWIVPTGSRSSYRPYADQVYFWNEYISGRGNLAARPGTSNHGWGTAVDVATPQMVSYIKKYGSKYGWKKIEAPSEWWHYNYVGGYKSRSKPKRYRYQTKTMKQAINRLFYHRKGMRKEEKTGRGPKYAAHLKWARYWKAVILKEANRLYAAGKKKGWAYHHIGVRQKELRDIVNSGSRVS
jgi:hypothetical protein